MSNSNTSVTLGELWSIQESLLQTYRVIFVTLEIVVIALVTILLSLDNSNINLSLPFFILGVFIIPIWMSVCNARARAVVFIHWLIHKNETEKTIANPYTYFRQFQSNRMFKNINVLEDPYFQMLSKSKTRFRMDKQLPLVFAVMWLTLLLVFFMDFMA